MKGKSLIKIAGGLVAALVLLVGIAIVVIATQLDRIVRVGTEKALTYALMVPVTVDRAKVQPRDGIIELGGINIPNPEGWNTDRAMYIGTVRVEADIASFRTDEPIIKLIHLKDLEVTLEQDLKISNLQHLMNNAMSHSAGTEEKPAEEPAPEEGGKSVRIDKVIIEGTEVSVTLKAFGGKKATVSIPRREINDIGGKEGEEVTPAEALEQLLAAILGSITEFGAGIIPTEQLSAMANTLSETGSEFAASAGELLGDAADTVGGAAESVGNAVGDAVGGITGSLGLGGKKDKDKK